MSTDLAAPPPPATPTPPRFLNTSTLVIGVTGSGKSSLIATAAEYVYEEHGGILALYQTDLGGYPDNVASLIRHGIIWLFRCRTRGADLSFETLQLSSKGFWPRRVLNPITGEVPYGVPMVGPTTRRYTQVCGCTTPRTVMHKVALNSGTCASCGRVFNTRDTLVTQEDVTTPGVDRIKARAYDGLTSMSEWYLQDLSHRKELGGEMGAIGGVVESGGESFRGNNRAQVGFSQTRIHELVSNSLSIPGQVIMPVWTAIADETGDQTGRLTVVGPKLSGSAKTEIAPSWFGNTVEAQVVEGDREGCKIRRLYLSEFIDKEGRRHLCKHRGDPRYVPETLEDPPYSPTEPPTAICTDFSLRRFYQLLDAAADKSAAEVLARFPDAPGLDSVPTSFGFEESAAPVGAVSADGTPAAVAAPKVGGLKARAGAAPRVTARPRLVTSAAAAPVLPVTDTPASPADDTLPTAEEAAVPYEELAGPPPAPPAPPEPQTPAATPAATATTTSAPVPPTPPVARPVARPAGAWATPAGGAPKPRTAAPTGTVIRRPVPPPTATPTPNAPPTPTQE